MPELAIVKTPDYKTERGKTECCHPEPVYSHVDKDFGGKDTDVPVVWRPGHDIIGSNFHAKTHCWEARGNHDNPQNLHRCERENRNPSTIFKGKAYQESAGLCNIFGKKMQDELFPNIRHFTEKTRTLRERLTFLILSNMRRPSSIELRIEAKLSSVRTI